jgi:hypothetical protein|tara:strand:+ start:256 stop:468 length:213 start_codon:yes stop_codon:yes gene_type:complete
MKAREIRAALQGKMDPEQLHCLCSVAEEMSAITQEIHAVAELLNQFVDVVGGITETMGEIREIAEKKHNV